jgi:hypothetical protein
VISGGLEPPVCSTTLFQQQDAFPAAPRIPSSTAFLSNSTESPHAGITKETATDGA